MTILVQVLLTAVILTLTFFVSIAGFQIFYILYEFRHALKKLNRILDSTQALSESASRPLTAVNDFFAEVKDLVHHTQDEIITSVPDRIISPPPYNPPAHPATKPSPRRFFHRSGLPLRPS